MVVCSSAGPLGGVSATIQVRMTLAELVMSSIPSPLPVPRVRAAFGEDYTPESAESRTGRADRFPDAAQ